MASDNKTILDVCARMRKCAAECTSHGCSDMERFADEIEGLHKREIREAVKPIEANYESMLKQFADKEEQYVRCRIELNDASKNLDECKAELEKARENGKQMWLNALQNSSSKSELHQMLMQAVHEKYKEELAAKDREIAGLREKMGDDDLLKMAKDIDEKNRKILILEERVKIAMREFEKIYVSTTDKGIGFIAGDALSALESDDNEYQCLFEAKPEEKSE